MFKRITSFPSSGALLSRIWWITAAVFVCTGAASALSQSTVPPGKPNILFIIVDDLRPELGCYGVPMIQTPNIDRLASQGIVFTRAYSQQTLCNPSRASILTGLRPDTLQVWDLQTNFRKYRPDLITLPQFFRGHGYHALKLGKIYHNTLPDPPSWSSPEPKNPVLYHYLSPKTRADLWERTASAKRLGRRENWINSVLRGPATESWETEDNRYSDGANTDLAVKLLGELKDKEPFFLAIGYQKPHLPYVAPKKYWDLYDRKKIPLADNPFLPENAPLFAMNFMWELACYQDFSGVLKPTEGQLSEEQARLLKHGYYACVSYIDAQIGRLLEALDRHHLRDNTIIVLMSDHGVKLGEHRSWGKKTNYEIDTRSPLIISVPGAAGNGRTCHALVEYVDIYPTLAELAGLPLSSRLEGFSMAPLFNNPDREWKSAVFSQFPRGYGGLYMGRAIRTERYRYVEWRNWIDNTFIDAELYDHETDPQENINIAPRSENQQLLQELSRRLWQGWWAARPPVKSEH